MILHLKKHNRIDAMKEETKIKKTADQWIEKLNNLDKLNCFLDEQKMEKLYLIIAYCQNKGTGSYPILRFYIEAKIRSREAQIRANEAVYHKSHSTWIKWSTIFIAFASFVTAVPIACKIYSYFSSEECVCTPFSNQKIQGT